MQTPVVLQTEAAECGLAVLAMLLGHHGHHAPLVRLRQRFQLSARGCSLLDLMKMAHEMGLAARAVRLEVDALAHLKMPAILHWDMRHFVVLTRVTRAGVEIIDPACGRRTVALRELCERFSGVALELQPTPDFAEVAPAPRLRLRSLVGPVDGLRGALLKLLAISALVQLFLLLGPALIQWTIDSAIVYHDPVLLPALGLGFLFLLLFQVLFAAIRSWAVVYLATSLRVQWTLRVASHMLRLPMAWFERRQLGDVISRLGSIKHIERSVSTSFIEAFIDGGMAVLTLTVMLMYSPMLTAVALGAAVLYFLLRGLLFRKLRAAQEEKLVRDAREQSHLIETVHGVQTVRMLGAEPLRQGAWQNLLLDAASKELDVARIGVGIHSVESLISGAEKILCIWIGATIVMADRMSVGMLLAFIAYKDQFLAKLNGLVDKWIELRMLGLHGERLADIVLAAPEQRFAAELGTTVERAGKLSVRDLALRYADNSPWVIKDCSFEIEEGESVAIVGPSGSGKTTLAKALLGLLTPAHGTIAYGGMDLSRWSAAGFRGTVAAVMQEDQLFAGSIADNICFFAPGTDPAMIETAARRAGVHDDIRAMPMGYETIIGDMGASLSGGQKQRLILARALFRRPQVLILDEATSHLDVDREHSVNATIRALDLTRIIIAHRPETIASADRVLELRGGQLVERGVSQVAAPRQVFVAA